ncbi:MAG: hypothetical protein V4555_17240 [Acidobacteriota bacterium]
MAAAHKKVVVRRFEGGLSWGYLPAMGLLSSGQVTLLEVDGRAKSIDLSEIKTIAYVRDFNLDDSIDPERVGKTAFAGRPRGEGLWLRLGFQDGETLEGLANFDMGFIETLIEDRGLFLAPPDPKSNTLRVFVPRGALKTVELLGLVTSPSKRAGAQKESAKAVLEKLQAELF